MKTMSGNPPKNNPPQTVYRQTVSRQNVYRQAGDPQRFSQPVAPVQAENGYDQQTQVRPPVQMAQPRGTRLPNPTQVVNPVSVPPAAAQPRIQRKKRTSYSSTEVIIGLAVGSVALAVLAGVAFFMMFVLFSMSDRILPGAQVGDTPIGGMRRADASQMLWAEWNENRQVIVTDGRQAWMDTPTGLGLYLDAEATVEKAYQLGRGSGGITQFLGFLTLQKEQVLPEVMLNMTTARSRLEDYAVIIDSPPQDASLLYQNGEWTSVPGQPGYVIDQAASAANLADQRTLVMSSGYFLFSMTEVQPEFNDVSGALAVLEPLLNRPMRFSAYDPITDERVNWTVEPDTFAPWLRVEDLQGEPNVTVKTEELAAYLEEWQSTNLSDGKTLQENFDIEDVVDAWRNDDRYDFIVWHPAKTYTVKEGDMLSSIAYRARMPYWMILEANPSIDPDALVVGSDLIIPSKNELLPLPIVTHKRIVISITEQRMWTYKNGELLDEYVISTGVDESPTLPGVYQVQTHELEAYASVWDLYMPHFLGIYQGWPGFWNGIHGLPTLSSGVQLWASVLGSKASYGCIIMDLQSAEKIYNWAEDGVVVEITP